VKPEKPITWKEAFMASPGPKSGREALILSIKGVCMGAADTVPGVSGGTIALITGIYEQLLAAIRSVDAKMLSRLFRLDVKGALVCLHTRFILFLFIGIATAIMSLARVMSHLLAFHPIPTWSLFFGLIAASIWSVGRKVDYWTAETVVMFLAGAVFAYAVVGLVPAATPETFSFVFVSGMFAISAMILPGLSGAFILVLLGKYEFIVSTLKNPFLPENMMIIVVFAAGCAAGLAGFSRILKYLLEKFRPATMAFLTGLMLGSLRRIWPWKEIALTDTINEQIIVLKHRNVLPEPGFELVVAVCLMLAGIAAVVFLEWVSSTRKEKPIMTPCD
jgi:putative membrane protein